MERNLTKLAVITHVTHKNLGNNIYAAYGPYVKEMNLWFRHVGDVEIVAPLSGKTPDKIDLPYAKPINLTSVPEIDLTEFKAALYSLISLPYIFFRTIGAMRRADHIHLRCPGNMGLIGCIAQIFFPQKPKSAKYAGNWDPNSAQPLTYRIQRKLLNNTFLTKNIKVMVYGSWPDATKNVVPFFTASYRDSQKTKIEPRLINRKNLRLIFVGALIESKQPILSVQIVEKLLQSGITSELDIFGNGPEMGRLKEYVSSHNLSDQIRIHGNQPAAIVEEYFRQAHFLIFLSRSEGWPKVVAEAMWWGCLPITTAVSCVPEMLGNESRGSLIPWDTDIAVSKITSYLEDGELYRKKAIAASEWAQQFTLERFENAISELLN